MPPSPKSSQSPVESYTEALEVHLSNLQTRLSATLDALDELTRNHELELEELHVRAHSLHAKCQIFKARAKHAEAERDELREGVNKLVEKVEIANDHRVLPYSRIHLPDPLESASFRSSIRLEDDINRDAYFPAMLSGLRAELTAKNYAFSELRRISEARIATLEAQVARRDAELQACIQVSHNLDKRISWLGRTCLPDDQATIALGEATVRQRTLEVEIEGLRRNLQSARFAASRPKWERPAPQPSVDTSSKTRDPSLTHPSTPHVQLDPPTQPVISEIDRQLVHIRRHVDNLQAERDNMAIEANANGASDGTSRQTDDHEDERLRGILLIEEECIRLRQSERSLRQQLLVAKAASSATEQTLKSLVNRLQQQVQKLTPDTSGDESRKDRDTKEDIDPLEDKVMNDVASEQTITTHVEAPLSTPPLRCSTPLLRPSALYPPSWRDTNDRDSNVQLSYSRPPSAPPSLPQPPNLVQQQSIARLARIESELYHARNDMEAKDRAIDSLQRQLAALQTAVQARTKGEKESS